MKYFCSAHYSNLKHFDMVFTIVVRFVYLQRFYFPITIFPARFVVIRQHILEMTKFEFSASFCFILNIWYVIAIFDVSVGLLGFYTFNYR